MRSVVQQGAQHDGAWELAGVVVDQGEFDVLGALVEAGLGGVARAHVGHRHVAPGRGGRWQVVVDVELVVLHIAHRDSGKLRYPKVVAACADGGGRCGQDANHFGGDVDAAQAPAQAEVPKVGPLAATNAQIKHAADDAGDAFEHGVFARAVDARIGFAGGAGNAVAADKAVVHQPPGVVHLPVWAQDLAFAEEQDFGARIGRDARLQRHGQLYGEGAGLVAQVELEGARQLQHTGARQGQARQGGDVGHVDARNAHRRVGHQGARADHHGLTRGAGDDTALVFGQHHAARCRRGVIGIGELGGLDVHGDVALADHLLGHHAAGDVAQGVVRGLEPAGQVHHTDDGFARLVGGNEAIGTDAGNGFVAAEVARAAGGIGVGGMDVDRLARIGIHTVHLELARTAGHQGQVARVHIGLDDEGGSLFAVTLVCRCICRCVGHIQRRRCCGVDGRYGTHGVALRVGVAHADEGCAHAGGADAVAGIHHLHGVGTLVAHAAKAGGLHGKVLAWGQGNACLVFKVPQRAQCGGFAQAQVAQLVEVGQADGDELGGTYIHRQFNRCPRRKPIIGLHGHGCLPAVAFIGRKEQGLAIATQARAAVGGAQYAPEDGIALQVLGHGVQAQLGGQVGVGLARGQHIGRNRSLVGLEAVVGIEHLAVGGVDLAIAIDVALQAGAGGGLHPGLAVLAIDHAVVVHVPGQAHTHLGAARAL